MHNLSNGNFVTPESDLIWPCINVWITDKYYLGPERPPVLKDLHFNISGHHVLRDQICMVNHMISQDRFSLYIDVTSACYLCLHVMCMLCLFHYSTSLVMSLQ